MLLSLVGLASGLRRGIIVRDGHDGMSRIASAILVSVFAVHAHAAFSVRDFGARGDGTNVDTVAIQKALDEAGRRGGEVVLPAGRYVSGSLVLPSHTTLRLERGAALLGSGEKKDYPLVTARWEGIDRECHRSLLWAEKAEDLAIVGEGTIEGNPVVGKLRNPRGPPVIEFRECDWVRVEGVTLRSTRMWTLHPTYCRDVIVKGVTFETSSANSDGIDPDSCQRVHIEGCTFTTGDDGIAIKSGKGQEGARIGRPCEDIVITNCTFKKGYTSIAFGSELSGGIRRVRISNCTFGEAKVAALQFKARPGRGGYVEDVVAEHLTVGPAPLLEMTTSYSYNPDPQGIPGVDGHTLFRNIRISDVKIEAKRLMSVTGTPEKPVEDLLITRVSGTCQQASSLQNVRNVALSNLHLEGVKGPQFLTNNVTGTGFEGAAPLATKE